MLILITCLNSQQISEKEIGGQLVHRAQVVSCPAFLNLLQGPRPVTGHVESGEWEQTLQNSPVYLLSSSGILGHSKHVLLVEIPQPFGVLFCYIFF